MSHSNADFYFPVQLVVRQDAIKLMIPRLSRSKLSAVPCNRGRLFELNRNGLTAKVTEIITPKGEVTQAVAGEVITLRLDRDIDISRGDLFVVKVHHLHQKNNLKFTICWFDERPLNTARKYLLKHGTQTVFAKISEIESVLNVHTLEQESGATALKMNDIARVRLSLQKPIVATTYEEKYCWWRFYFS